MQGSEVGLDGTCTHGEQKRFADALSGDLGGRNSRVQCGTSDVAPTDTQTGGGNLRLDEAGGWITVNKVSGVGQDEYGGLTRGHGAQPGPDDEATGQCARGDSSHPSGVTSPWRSASSNPRMGQTRTIIDP